MHSTLGKRTLLWAGILALVAAVALPSPAGAVPEKGAKGRGFRLFARSLGAMTVNRIYCGLNSVGEVCVDSTNSSTIGGGYWPKGTADQYIFNSGLQLAGIIGADGGPWAGDTTGAFFFDPKGTTVHGTEVRPIYNASSQDDIAGCSPDPTAADCAWPAEGLVPIGDTQADFFNPLLQGRVSASQGDIWYLTWEGDPGLNAGRPHPLGILSEVRGLGWNYPTGNEDILYFIYTFYNITTLNAAAYSAARPEMQPILLQQAQQFHTRNNSSFGITLPTNGYTIENLFAAFSRDDDVADAGANYSSVNLPFALGYTYEHTFYGPNQSSSLGWTFDPTIFSAPFFPGPGFTAAKYLASPAGPGEIQLFSNTINGGDFNDAQNTTQLYRYLSGNISTAAGDEACSYDPVADRICYINNVEEDDMRFFQSSTPLSLAPGEFGHIVVAYIHAAPVALPAFTGATSADIKPDDPRILVDAVGLAANGANMIDSLMGFLDYEDLNSDGIVEQTEFTVVPGSTLSKALVAQTIFDAKFLLPFSPEVPQFFVVPGDNQVTVLWQPSPTETVGDPYFDLASSPLNPDLSVNALYDANYRSNDVEGYRVYRGRVNNPTDLQLIAQFDYDGTTFADYYGIVNPSLECAPELGITGDCPVSFSSPAPGDPYTVSAEYGIVSPFVQSAARVELADGTVLVTEADTATTGEASGSFPALEDTGVPFVFVDQNVRNGFRYFYSVTAFDVNSLRSGPSSLESPRATKAATPTKSASNYTASGSVTGITFTGRGVALDNTAPNATIDPATGIFSGPAPPSNAWSLGFGDFVASLLAEPGSFSVQLDSVAAGSPYQNVPHTYWFTAVEAGVSFSVPILQQQEIGVRTGSAGFPAVPVDPTLAGLYGGGGGYNLQGSVELQIDGADYMSLYGRGCVNSRAGFAGSGGCAFNGSRWFDGPSPANNETFPHPNGGNGANFTASSPMTTPNNAGSLTGVVNIHNTQAYQQAGGASYRPIEGIKAGMKRAADFNVYWGAGGTIDSVIDVTHNVVVPFDSAKAGGTWGILNASAAPPGAVGNQSYDRRAELTNTDMGCVEPFRSYRAGIACGDPALGPPQYFLSRTAVPGPIVTTLLANNEVNYRNDPTVQPNAGFILYVSGDWFTFEMAGGAVPAAGSVWALRQYIGAIRGGQNSDGSINYGDYVFTPSAVRALTAVGAAIGATYDVTNTVALSTDRDLRAVHTVPDPYYVTNEFEQTTDNKVLKFVNLPQQAIIRIYSASGVLVDVLEHDSPQFSGEATWNVRNRNNQVVASGVYFYHIESGEARKVGRFTVVNFAQ